MTAENTRRRAERARTLRQQQFISQVDLESAEATADTARATLARVLGTEAPLGGGHGALSGRGDMAEAFRR